VLVFGAGGYLDDAAPFFDLADAFPRSVHIGCSTEADISGDALLGDAVTVAGVRFDHGRLRAATTTIAATDEDAEAAGLRLAAQLPRQGLRAVFAVSDGACVNGGALLRGIVAGLPADVTVSGGMAGDLGRVATTWVYGHDGQLPAPARACVVGLYGKRLRIGHGHATGWAGLGPERRITRARGNVLFELDGMPALDVYKDQLGDIAAELPGAALRFPLAVRRAESTDRPLIRSVIAIDEVRRALVFSGELPAGGRARLMRAQVDDLVASAARATTAAMSSLPDGGDSLLISVSCFGRRLMMGERNGDEAQAMRGGHGSHGELRRVGFYSFGEFSPCRSGHGAELHNQTLALTAWAEA
jgi:hypothetical protein